MTPSPRDAPDDRQPTFSTLALPGARTDGQGTAAQRVADWLGMVPEQLRGVPAEFLAAVATRLDEATEWIPGLRDELLEHAHDRVALFEHRALVDTLTGIANRRSLDERLELEVRRARRYRRPLSLILCDVDGLKQVNDTLGHAAGDAYLSTVARRLADAVRGTDLVGRWGGDEFAVVSPETGALAAARLARKLEHVVSAAPLVLPGGVCAVSISTGTATAHDPWSVDGLHGEADAALYRAKARSAPARREGAAR